ncbi:MAG: acyl-CoA/acyl-ACP dehydrogenase [Gammaproteobacteria bacterium]|nr:acyl-CoA/acyl-ACP dehydrogenase [Gammaproteobacteria bacterium]
MDFDFSPELKTLQETARDYLSENCGPTATRRVLESDEYHDADAWQTIAGLGWLASSLPERFGGLDMGQLAVCVLAAEVGRALSPLPFSMVSIATDALLRYGSEQQQLGWLPKLADGRCIGTIAIAERPGFLISDGFDCRVDGGRLSGEKTVVPDAQAAEFAVVAARYEQGGVGLFLAALHGDTVEVVGQHTVDPSRSHARLRFSAHPVEPLPGARHAEAIGRLLERAAIVVAFEQLGVAEAALQMACSHARSRYAFGRPIGSFQAIKHKLADVYIAVELARSNCYYGAWALANDAADLPLAAATARVAATQAYHVASKENIQTHGGMGFTWEFDCQFHYRRSRVLALNIGSLGQWQDKLINAAVASDAA